MGPLSSPVVTSNMFPIVTIGVSLTAFSQWTDRRTDGIGLAKDGTTYYNSASAARNRQYTSAVLYCSVKYLRICYFTINCYNGPRLCRESGVLGPHYTQHRWPCDKCCSTVAVSFPHVCHSDPAGSSPSAALCRFDDLVQTSCDRPADEFSSESGYTCRRSADCSRNNTFTHNVYTTEEL